MLAAATQPLTMLSILHRRATLPTLPIKNLHVASPNMVTLWELVAQAIRPVVEPVVVEDKSIWWGKVWSKIS